MHWTNLQMPFHSRYIRGWIWDLATFALVLFWAIPVAFVASLTTMEELSNRLPFLDPIFNASPVIKGERSEEWRRGEVR